MIEDNEFEENIGTFGGAININSINRNSIDPST
jgi:hypothetical protein